MKPNITLRLKELKKSQRYMLMMGREKRVRKTYGKALPNIPNNRCRLLGALYTRLFRSPFIP